MKRLPLGLLLLAACSSTPHKRGHNKDKAPPPESSPAPVASTPAPTPAPVAAPPPAGDAALAEQLNLLAKQVGEQIGQLEKKVRLAVLPLTDTEGHVNGLGRYASEKIVTGVPRSEHFELIERARLDQVMTELKLSSTELISDETVASLGNLVGADALLIGTFTDLGASLDVNCRIVEPETGLILATANTMLERSPAVDKLWGGAKPSAPAAGNGSGTAPAASPPGPPKKSELPMMEPNVNRPGHDYFSFEMTEPKPRACQKACAEDQSCRAFSYEKPGHSGPKPKCYLKNGHGHVVVDVGVISGVKTEALADFAKGAPVPAEAKMFVNPRFEGARLALCLSGGKGCGDVVATEWCQKQSYARARHHTAAAGIGATAEVKNIRDGSLCKKPSCNGFSSITCVR